MNEDYMQLPSTRRLIRATKEKLEGRQVPPAPKPIPTPVVNVNRPRVHVGGSTCEACEG